MQARSGGFICVETKLQPIVGGYAHKNIPKEYSSGVAFSRHCNAILVLNPKDCGIARTHVNMTQCADHSLVKRYARSGALDENAWRSLEIARLACGCGNAQLKCIRRRQFHLICRSRRSDDSDIGTRPWSPGQRTGLAVPDANGYVADICRFNDSRCEVHVRSRRLFGMRHVRYD